mmetsp:Transcript_12747/g.39947  ORF Transcript_12747/g.39947 Transcript_12747/m.39947 type:complete len:218 (+) Transcript_12747:2608-3261(+)
MGRIGVGVDTLHLVEDHALVHKGVLLLLNLVMPALLCEHERVVHGPGVQHRVEVDVNEVVKVLEVAACDRVASAVGEGHGVQERLQTALQELDEGLLKGILAAAAKDRVLEHVGDAVGVFRGCAEHHTKGLVLIRGLHHGHELRARAVMLKEVAGAAELLDVLSAGASPAMQLLPYLVRCGHGRLHYSGARNSGCDSHVICWSHDRSRPQNPWAGLA